jgi:hypothetical protein
LKNPQNIKLQENPYSGSQDVPCGQTNRAKLIAAFCNFVNGPKKCVQLYLQRNGA